MTVYVALPSIHGTLFTHNYLGLSGVQPMAGELTDVLEDVNVVASPRRRRVYLAIRRALFQAITVTIGCCSMSPNTKVAVSPDRTLVVVATLSELKRFDLTGRLIAAIRPARTLKTSSRVQPPVGPY